MSVGRGKLDAARQVQQTPGLAAPVPGPAVLWLEIEALSLVHRAAGGGPTSRKGLQGNRHRTVQICACRSRWQAVVGGDHLQPVTESI